MNGGQIVFWRASSYLPHWKTDQGTWYFNEIIERSSDGYDKAQRAYLIVADGNKMTCEIKASYDSPIVNPCFVVKNWKQKEAKVPVVGQQPENVKIGNPSMVTDKDMVVWLKLESEDKVKIIIE